MLIAIPYPATNPKGIEYNREVAILVPKTIAIHEQSHFNITKMVTVTSLAIEEWQYT